MAAAGSAAGGGQGELIGDFQCGREEAGGENGADGAGGGGHGGEPRHQERLEGGQRDEFQGRFRDHAEQAFGTDKQAGEIEAGFVFMGASAQLDDLAAGLDDLQTEDKIAGDAVFEAARSAGVGGDVAADGAVGAAGGIRRIVEALFFHGFLQGLQDDARLDDGHKIAGVDFLDAVHAGQGKDNAAAGGDASADVAEAGPARGDGDAVAAGKTQEEGDGVGAAGQGHRVGQAGGEPFVAGMSLARGGVQAQHAGRQEFLELPQGARRMGVHGLEGSWDLSKARASSARSSGTWSKTPPEVSTPRTTSSFFTLTVKPADSRRPRMSSASAGFRVV